MQKPALLATSTVMDVSFPELFKKALIFFFSSCLQKLLQAFKNFFLFFQL